MEGYGGFVSHTSFITSCYRSNEEEGMMGELVLL